MKTAEELIEDILEREGPGDPTRNYLAKNDRGGRTNWGISEVHHPEEWANGKVPDKDRARVVLTENYLKPFAGVRNDAIRAQLVDWCVLHGEGRTRRWVTRCITVNAKAVAQATNDAINEVGSMPFFNDALVAWRLLLIDQISDADVKQKSNEEGWENRALSFLQR